MGKELREQPGFQADLAHYLSGMRFVGRPVVFEFIFHLVPVVSTSMGLCIPYPNRDVHQGTLLFDMYIQFNCSFEF